MIDESTAFLPGGSASANLDAYNSDSSISFPALQEDGEVLAPYVGQLVSDTCDRLELAFASDQNLAVPVPLDTPAELELAVYNSNEQDSINNRAYQESSDVFSPPGGIFRDLEGPRGPRWTQGNLQELGAVYRKPKRLIY